MKRRPACTHAQHLAVRVLARTAQHLATTTAPMDDNRRTLALNTAMDGVLNIEPSKYQRSAARRLALMAMPPISGTTTEYADRLRALATGTPTCCGRPMNAEDGQLVCSNCGSWVDPGATGRTLVGSDR